MMRKTVLSCLLMLAAVLVVAQDKTGTRPDSVTITRDTTIEKSGDGVEKIVSYSNRYDPRKALLLAAVLPGSGQIYNKKYWKLPLVYGGLGLVVNAVAFYQKSYVKYKSELYISINGGTPASGLDQTTLRSVVDYSRRERDYFMIIGGLVYLLQMVDAHVDAHLKEFDLNPRLKVAIQPFSEQNMMMGKTAGASLLLKF